MKEQIQRRKNEKMRISQLPWPLRQQAEEASEAEFREAELISLMAILEA